MKVNVVSTKPDNCGIGITNQYTIDGMKPYLKSNGITLTRVFIDYPFSKNPFYFVQLAFQAIRYCDIVHVHYNHDCFGKFWKVYGLQNFIFYPILKLFNKPIITTFHEHPDLPEKGLRRRFYYILNYCPLKLSNHVIVTTARTRDQILKQN